ncbi:hypothetical protein CHU00_14010 [Sphingobacterium cellulitidis]|uniref:hypothetical protein n=1 Tax=Sphingobacterium cellulitidis TaxID=1768011 RepID=UPI000B93E563|nr:hypothetical protein [Sphingobacterium cellulitidis]OYD44969.1 hypothetical protein CHU00_14010 [Sphingobacterium cellulitidis]
MKKFLFTFLICLTSWNLGFSQEVKHSERSIRGKISSPVLGEISGIISSINNPGMFWVHNDSGDKARVYLIDSAANLMCTYQLEGIDAIDIEDIAWVELNGKSNIVLADVGDNLGQRSNISLYVFPEPVFSKGTKQDTIAKTSISVKTLSYPGKARDAEAIFVDPLDKQFYIISKREFQSSLYTADVFGSAADHFQLKPLMRFPFTFITAADISSKRDAIIMKNLTNIYYWPIGSNESIVKALQKSYLPIPYEPEPQGEAITFDRLSDGFYTISERPFGLDSYLYYYYISKP